MSQPPYFDSLPANFIDAEGRYIYVLMGTVLDRTQVALDHPVHILIAPDAVREYNVEFLPLFEFFRVPREEYQVREWLEWAGGDDDMLQMLLDTQTVIRIDTHSPETAADSLRGIYIVATCMPLKLSPDNPYIIYVHQQEEDEDSLPIDVGLGDYFWGSDEVQDIPNYVDKVVKEWDLPRKEVIRTVINGVPSLISHNYAYLIWSEVPTYSDE